MSALENDARRVLVVAAHPDDEVLGCGATIARWVERGWRAQLLILTGGCAGRASEEQQASPAVRALQAELHEQMTRAAAVLGFERVRQLDLPDNRLDAVSLMDISHAMRPVLEDFDPEVVLTHHPGDYNWDHTRCFEALLMAARANPGDRHPKEIWSFEVLSSTERAWQRGATAFHPNIFVDVADSMERKRRALECYALELRPFPHPRSWEAVEALAIKRGTEVGLRRAEAFQLVRRILTVEDTACSISR